MFHICKKVLSVTYLNEQSISEPKENESKLFSFSDENIPKIENSKIATYTNDTTLDDVIKYIETKNGIQRKMLKPGDEPKAIFKLVDDEFVFISKSKSEYPTIIFNSSLYPLKLE